MRLDDFADTPNTYIIMVRQNAEIHISGGKAYISRTTLRKPEEEPGKA